MATRLLTALIVITLALPWGVAAQPPTADVWRTFAATLDPGSDVMVRLQNGQRFRATLIEARPEALLLQPRTRRPVPVQAVDYGAVTLLERHENRGGSIGKAIAVGAGVGAATFLAILAIFAASLD